MFIGILKVEIFIPASNSLKHKRMILNSLTKRLRNNFNVSVSCLGNRDKWQRALLAIVNVVENKRDADKVLSYARNFLEEENTIQVLNYETEVI
jgi:uncharacterized protein YlxP (DUF503 family)